MRATRALSIVVLGLIFVVPQGEAITLEAAGLSSYSSMSYANSLLLATTEREGAAPALNVGYGLRFQGTLPLAKPLPLIYCAAWGVGLAAEERDVAASATLLALALGAEMQFDRWTAHIGLCGGRSSFDLPASGLEDLVGLGGGVEIGASVVFPLGASVALVFRLGAQWLPIQEMTDKRGQTYRGRGMPFVDYTGLRASLGLRWSP